MKITIEMPAVSNCSVDDCAFNVNEKCHAKAITIGDGKEPHCDTLYCGSNHIHNTKIKAGVGACKVMGCSHNDDMECTAQSIKVGMVGDDVHCLTYKMA